MKIILYEGANPDSDGLIGEVIEVSAEKGNRLIGRGMAKVVEHDKPPPSKPVAMIAAAHLRPETTPSEDQPEDELEDDDNDEDEAEE